MIQPPRPPIASHASYPNDILPHNFPTTHLRTDGEGAEHSKEKGDDLAGTGGFEEKVGGGGRRAEGKRYASPKV